MEKIKIWNDSPADNQIQRAATLLREGEMIIIPTDSVYAIACDALNNKAITRLCRLKGIDPEKQHLSILCSDIAMASEYVRIEDESYNLLKRLTPGPYTFLFRAGRNLPKAFKGRKIVGIRIPDNITDREIIRELGTPLMTTTIDLDNDDYAREPDLIAERYENRDVAMIIDAGEGELELSTILDCSDSSENPVIIRQGKGEVF